MNKQEINFYCLHFCCHWRKNNATNRGHFSRLPFILSFLHLIRKVLGNKFIEFYFYICLKVFGSLSISSSESWGLRNQRFWSNQILSLFWTGKYESTSWWFVISSEWWEYSKAMEQIRERKKNNQRGEWSVWKCNLKELFSSGRGEEREGKKASTELLWVTWMLSWCPYAEHPEKKWTLNKIWLNWWWKDKCCKCWRNNSNATYSSVNNIEKKFSLHINNCANDAISELKYTSKREEVEEEFFHTNTFRIWINMRWSVGIVKICDAINAKRVIKIYHFSASQKEKKIAFSDIWLVRK